TNGVVATCDAAGAVVAHEACPLGCFEAEPRCRDIDPSNGLGAALDQADTAPVLDLSAGGSIDTTTGQVFGVGGPILIPSVLLPAPADGVAILVLIVKSAILGQVSVVTSGLNPDRLRWRHRGA
ncbi:MAG: hypothetical protein KA190_05390, partial [Kofleriaceae bacterium]|nr:hypothetical protein [Kofleriaceae bacterium]